MKRSAKLTRALLMIGVAFIVAAVLITVVPMISQKIARSKNTEILGQMYSLIPQVRAGSVDDRIDMDMPSLEIDGMNFVGIIEVPKHSVHLPVYSSWDGGKVSRFPCRYTGSIYDGSLIIGGSDGAGQFDFSKTISIGDTVSVTDMTGARYSYRVAWVEITDDVSRENLASLDAELVLFMRSSTSIKYTVIMCDRK
ncbi:MAG: sortase [Ruminococcaceae bacterium]|nr:sortase [Oscillospiraceae bacterium]